MQAVIVVSPVGEKLAVSQVVLDDGATVWAQGAGGAVVPSKRTYPSLDEAVAQNDRATTTAYEVTFDDAEAAVAAVGQPPPALA